MSRDRLPTFVKSQSMKTPIFNRKQCGTRLAPLFIVSVRIPMKSDTDSDSIRTGFRPMSDSVPEFAGQFLGAKRRSGSTITL